MHKQIPSKCQILMYKAVKERFNDAKMNFPLTIGYCTRYLDVAIPSKRIDIEFDGPMFHNDKTKDAFRTKQIRSKGWKVFRIKNLDEIKKVLQCISANLT